MLYIPDKDAKFAVQISVLIFLNKELVRIKKNTCCECCVLRFRFWTEGRSSIQPRQEWTPITSPPPLSWQNGSWVEIDWPICVSVYGIMWSLQPTVSLFFCPLIQTSVETFACIRMPRFPLVKPQNTNDQYIHTNSNVWLCHWPRRRRDRSHVRCDVREELSG